MIEVDDRQVLRMFKELGSKNRKKVFRSAIKLGLGVVKKKAEANLRGVVNNINKKDKWGKSLKQGIKVKVARDAENGKIHIMGNFKLKFFQMGTDLRRIKKYKNKTYPKGAGPKRGSIKASHFFTKAVNSEERKVFNSLDKLISQSIVKINNKYR